MAYKTNYKRKSVVRKITKKPKMTNNKKSLVALIKKVALKPVETKRIFVHAENQQLYHNTVLQANNLLTTSVGTTQSTRIGDAVVGVGLSLKIWLSQKLDRPNIMYRLIVFHSSISTGLISFANGSIGNKMLATVDTDAVGVIKQFLITPKAGDFSLETGAANKERSTYKSFNINLNKRIIKYNGDGGAQPRDLKNNINVAIIAYDSFGTLITDNIASFAYQACFYFKDP